MQQTINIADTMKTFGMVHHISELALVRQDAFTVTTFGTNSWGHTKNSNQYQQMYAPQK